MGIGNFTEDDSQNSGSRKYTDISKAEFEHFLDSLHEEVGRFVEIETGDFERVYELKDDLTDNGLSLRIYSTIDKRTEDNRDKGTDAIRTVIVSRTEDGDDIVVGGRTKTLRIETWEKNLKKKIVDIYRETQDYIEPCPEDYCSGYLVEREGKYGEFLGCTKYPSCDHTEQID